MSRINLTEQSGITACATALGLPDTLLSPAETSLYYLQSRYYNPEWGRFINADSSVDIGRGMISHNMFTYCENNPVSRIDKGGDLWWLIVPVAIIIAGSLGGCSSNKSTPSPTPSPSPTKKPSPTKNSSPSPSPTSKPMPADLKKLIATVAAEALSTRNPREWEACAHVMMNRVGKYEWKNQNLSQVLNADNFAVGELQYDEALKYLNSGRPSSHKDSKYYEQLIATVVPVYYGQRKDFTGGAVFFSGGPSKYTGIEVLKNSGLHHKFFLHK